MPITEMKDTPVEIHSEPELKEEMQRPIYGSCACFGTLAEEGKLLVIDYFPHHIKNPEEKQVKFPGGSNKRTPSRTDRTPEETLFAEVREEVLGSDGTIKGYRPVHRVTKSNEHTQFFSLLSIDQRTGTISCVKRTCLKVNKQTIGGGVSMSALDHPDLCLRLN